MTEQEQIVCFGGLLHWSKKIDNEICRKHEFLLKKGTKGFCVSLKAHSVSLFAEITLKTMKKKTAATAFS